MTKTKEELEEWDFSAVGKMPGGDILYSVSRELDNKIRAALTNAPEVVTVERIAKEIKDDAHIAYSWDVIMAKYPNGIKIVREK